MSLGKVDQAACIIQYSFLGFEACIIVLLLALLLKYHLQSSAGDKSKAHELKGQELKRDLQYAEICQQRLPPHPRSRNREENITYASVTTK
ncbi:hypothetical protein XENTR_v10021289 [Xenopus tropicalis]|nr:hypothetical protein XENTR_v10021289 [Xenopus tropicalis]